MSADGSVRTAEGTSRKRRRMSPDAGATSISENPTVDFANLAAPSNINISTEIASESAPADPHTAPCHHEATLRTLHADLDSMRQIITCNICQRFMYEPYALPCGHTYCYSCLAEWMGKNHKKSCPDCRSHVRVEPTPAFLIRQMVLIFVNRNQLLPDGETSEEHHKLAQEEAEILAKDRADTDERQGGLFKGTFSRPTPRAITAVHDTSDHVDRCPQCLHEVEDGWCLTCHVRVRSSDADTDDSDEDGTDMGDETDQSEENDLDIEAQDMAREFLGPWDDEGPHVYEGSSAEYDSDMEDDEHDLTGFVEDEVRWESDADEPDYSLEAIDIGDTPEAERRTAPFVMSDASSDSEDDNESVRPIRRRLVNRRSAPSSARITVTVRSDSDDNSEDEEDDDDDDDPVPTNSQRARRRNDYIDVDADAGASSSAAPSEDESEGTTRPAAGGLSPLHYNLSPVHDNPYEHSESAQDSDSHMGNEIEQGSGLSVDDQSSQDERSDDDEDNESDEMEEAGSDEMGEAGSDEDSEGSEQSMATGYSD